MPGVRVIWARSACYPTHARLQSKTLHDGKAKAVVLELELQQLLLTYSPCRNRGGHNRTVRCMDDLRPRSKAKPDRVLFPRVPTSRVIHDGSPSLSRVGSPSGREWWSGLAGIASCRGTFEYDYELRWQLSDSRASSDDLTARARLSYVMDCSACVEGIIARSLRKYRRS